MAEFISVVGGEGYYRIWLFHLGNDHYVFFKVVEPAALPAVDGLYYNLVAFINELPWAPCLVLFML